jgi:hypothetical protein
MDDERNEYRDDAREVLFDIALVVLVGLCVIGFIVTVAL